MKYNSLVKRLEKLQPGWGKEVKYIVYDYGYGDEFMNRRLEQLKAKGDIYGKGLIMDDGIPTEEDMEYVKIPGIEKATR